MSFYEFSFGKHTTEARKGGYFEFGRAGHWIYGGSAGVLGSGRRENLAFLGGNLGGKERGCFNWHSVAVDTLEP